MGNLFLAVEIYYGMLPTLKPNSYLHTQTSEIQVTTKWSKQLHIFCSVGYRTMHGYCWFIVRLHIRLCNIRVTKVKNEDSKL